MSKQKSSKTKPTEKKDALAYQSQKILEASIDGFCLVNLDGRLLEVNSAVCEITGYPKEELLKMNVTDLDVCETPEQTAQHLNNTLQRGYDRFETKHRRKDGKIIDVEISVQLYDSEGSKFFFSFFRDITAHKHIEQKLQESEKRYKTLFQGAVEGIAVADVETKKFTYVNPALCKMLGYTEEELLQLGVNDIHPKEDLQYVFSEFEAQARGEKILASLPCLCKDGTVIYADINAAAVVIDGRKCNVGFFSDITKRKQAEEEIRKFRTISEKANYGVAISDLDGNLIYVNEYFAAIHGYTAKQLVGKNLTLFHNEKQLKTFFSINEKLKEVGSLNALEIWHTHKSGTVFPMLMSSTIIKDENNEPKYMATTTIDITERKRLESEYEKYKEKILSVQRHVYISTLSSIVAHQINQPLTKISILLDRALEALNDTDNKTCCPAVLNNVKKGLAEAKNIDSIIRKFREHSKNPAQHSSVKANVNTVTNRIISTLSEKADQAKMAISTKSLNNLPEIEIDEIALEQILLIIIQNAIEAADGREKHKLRITGKLLDGNIELQFADNCCGIAPENLDRIFEPFFSTKTENGGLGLGLDILQQLLINCGGQVRVESKLDKGTAFYITLSVSAAV